MSRTLHTPSLSLFLPPSILWLPLFYFMNVASPTPFTKYTKVCFAQIKEPAIILDCNVHSSPLLLSSSFHSLSPSGQASLGCGFTGGEAVWHTLVVWTFLLFPISCFLALTPAPCSFPWSENDHPMVTLTHV